jgi:hypothetical protein
MFSGDIPKDVALKRSDGHLENLAKDVLFKVRTCQHLVAEKGDLKTTRRPVILELWQQGMR